jgi:protein FRA10AC1
VLCFTNFLIGRCDIHYMLSFAGQFLCGNRICDEKNGLGSYEVNFSYIEAGEQKQALVKLVACQRLVNPLLHFGIM